MRPGKRAGKSAGARRDPRIAARWITSLCLLPLLAGCATYSPLPLGKGEGAMNAARLQVSTTGMPMMPAVTHVFDPSDGLDATEVAMLAVANSPELKVKRDALGVARAQAFAAGLLPDPQLSLGQDFPQHSGNGLVNAYSVGLSEDIGAWLVRSSRMAAARRGADQVDLDLLWAEWQAVARARELFDQVIALRASEAVLERERLALASLDRWIQAALQAGNLTYDSARAGLDAGADVRKRLADNAQALHQAESDLRDLLGLAPTAPLDLVGADWQEVPASSQVQQALRDLPRRRPDLLALRAGYDSQQEKLRAAIRAQFPALSIGFNAARDTSAVDTRGFSIGITLPLFDRNRGNIAIEQATRQQLRDDYAARVLATRNDVARLLADLATLDRQRTALQAHARQLDQARAAAGQAWHQALLDWPTYLAIRASALSADLDLIAARQQQSTQAIALQALLGDSGASAGATPAKASTR